MGKAGGILTIPMLKEGVWEHWKGGERHIIAAEG